MFNTKKDRGVVEITIEFNIGEIGTWLKKGAKFEDINKIERSTRWDIKKKYVIDMFPIGKSDNAYFHRNKGLISQNIAGIDFLKKDESFVSWNDENVTYITKDKVGVLEWGIWHGGLALYADENPILLTPPLTELRELETEGVLSSKRSGFKDEDTKIKVPVSFDDNNDPKEFMEIWRGSANKRALGYGNALAHVSFSTLNFEVEY